MNSLEYREMHRIGNSRVTLAGIFDSIRGIHGMPGVLIISGCFSMCFMNGFLWSVKEPLLAMRCTSRDDTLGHPSGELTLS